MCLVSVPENVKMKINVNRNYVKVDVNLNVLYIIHSVDRDVLHVIRYIVHLKVHIVLYDVRVLNFFDRVDKVYNYVFLKFL